MAGDAGLPELSNSPTGAPNRLPSLFPGRGGSPDFRSFASPNARGGALSALALDFARAARALPGDLAQEVWRILARIRQRISQRATRHRSAFAFTAAGPTGVSPRRVSSGGRPLYVAWR